MKQRSISYYELSELEEQFDRQTKWIRFKDEEERSESLFDFVNQWINGSDSPMARIVEECDDKLNVIGYLKDKIRELFKTIVESFK